MDRTRLAANGLQFEAVVAGPAAGRLVVLLHGFPQSADAWSAQVSALVAAGHRVLVPDQRGYSPGARPAGVEAYRLPLLVADVLALVDAVAGEGAAFDLVGHDWGAAVAWHTAGRHADRVRTLTAVSVPHPVPFTRALREDPDQQSRSGYMAMFAAPGSAQRLLADGAAPLRALFGAGLPADRAAGYAARLAEPGALDAALTWYRAASIEDVRTMPDVTVPTLYVWSTDDPTMGRWAAERTRDHVAGPYRFEVLDGVSHWVPEQAADRLCELILQHLATYGG